MRDCKYALDIMKDEIKSKHICPEIKYAFKTSIEALEKQISKEVKTDTVNKGMGVSGEYDIESNMFCPNCKQIVGDYEADELYYDYCSNCGQKLKYTNPEE